MRSASIIGILIALTACGSEASSGSDPGPSTGGAGDVGPAFDAAKVQAWCVEECELDIRCGYFHENEAVSCQTSCGRWWRSFDEHHPSCVDEVWRFKHCAIPSGYCSGLAPECEPLEATFVACMNEV